MQRAEEEIARLSIETRAAQTRLNELDGALLDARGRTWALACQVLTTGAQQAMDSTIEQWESAIAWAEKVGPTFGEAGITSLRRLNKYYSKNTLLEYFRARIDTMDTSYLVEDDRARFLAWAHRVAETNSARLSVKTQNIISEDATPTQAVEQAKNWLVELKQAREVYATLLADCQSTWSAQHSGSIP
jgi:hypothetical protein